MHLVKSYVYFLCKCHQIITLAFFISNKLWRTFLITANWAPSIFLRFAFHGTLQMALGRAYLEIWLLGERSQYWLRCPLTSRTLRLLLNFFSIRFVSELILKIAYKITAQHHSTKVAPEHPFLLGNTLIKACVNFRQPDTPWLSEMHHSLAYEPQDTLGYYGV